jgi:hypothetical protein
MFNKHMMCKLWTICLSTIWVCSAGYILVYLQMTRTRVNHVSENMKTSTKFCHNLLMKCGHWCDKCTPNTTHVCVCICMYVCVYICMSICVCMYICVCVCVYVHMCVCICMSMSTLQTGRLRVWFPMVSLEFFRDIILPVALWPWGRLSL